MIILKKNIVNLANQCCAVFFCRRLHPAPEEQNPAEPDVQLAPLEDDLMEEQEPPAVDGIKQEAEPEGADVTEDTRDPPDAEAKGEQEGTEGRTEPCGYSI